MMTDIHAMTNVELLYEWRTPKKVKNTPEATAALLQELKQRGFLGSNT